MRQIAFLRAINVGGHTVKMARLKELFEELGAENVETFIASGNVLFDGLLTEKQIEDHLEKALGYAVATFLRTPAQLEKITAKPEKDGQLYIGFLKKVAAKDALEPFEDEDTRFEVHGHEFYWFSKTGMGRSKITGAKLEKALGGPTTMRSITTVTKIAHKR